MKTNNRSNYSHGGWTGEPYQSDFEAKWGLIRKDEMLDCSEIDSLAEGTRKAREQGYKYFIAKKESEHGNRLYKATINPRCVYRMLKYMEKNAVKETRKYNTFIDARLKQIMRVAKNRADKYGISYDLDFEDILNRAVRIGKCEATGITFDLRNVDSPFAPSLDQIVPRGGYTKENTRVVCMMFNLMKSDYTEEQVEFFMENARLVKAGKASQTTDLRLA